MLTMFNGVYADSKANAIVAIKPKVPFNPVSEVATTRKGSEVALVHERTDETMMQVSLHRMGIKWRPTCVRVGGEGRTRPETPGAGPCGSVTLLNRPPVRRPGLWQTRNIRPPWILLDPTYRPC